MAPFADTGSRYLAIGHPLRMTFRGCLGFLHGYHVFDARDRVCSIMASRKERNLWLKPFRRVDYFYVTAPNKPGEGVRMLSTLQEAGIRLLAFSGFPSGRRSQIDLRTGRHRWVSKSSQKSRLETESPQGGLSD